MIKLKDVKVVYPKTDNDELDKMDNTLYCKLHATYREADGSEPCWACENIKIKEWEAEDEGK